MAQTIESWKVFVRQTDIISSTSFMQSRECLTAANSGQQSEAARRYWFYRTFYVLAPA